MSDFLRLMDAYGDTYRLSGADRLRLKAHWPLFKLAFLADSRNDAAGDAARRSLKPLVNYGVGHTLRTPGGPLRVRAPIEPSGFASFSEIFLQREYATDLPSVRSFVDLGGNAGMASLYMASKFQLERLLVVEANPRLVPVIHRTLANVPGDVSVLNAAIVGASDPNGITFSIAKNHRMSSVDSSVGGVEVRVPALGLGDLLEQYNLRGADLLKMDIEGSEFDVLARDSDALHSFRSIFVEVHGPHRDAFVADLSKLGFDVEVRTTTDKALVVFATRS